MKTLILILSLGVLVSCQESQKSIETENPLSEVSLEGNEKIGSDDIQCTMIYDPVCASVKKDPNCIGESCLMIKATYSSSCTARADGAKVVYQGECFEEKVDAPEIKECAAIYNPVCGQLSTKSKEEKTFSNMCHLENSSATFLRYGTCDKSTNK